MMVWLSTMQFNIPMIHSFLSPLLSKCKHNSFVAGDKASIRLHGWKDLFDGAFANDPNLSSDKSLEQLEYENDDKMNPITAPSQRTEVQQRWWDAQQQASSSSSSSKPLEASMNLDDTCWSIDMYLTGIPDFDPNNSLYGAKVNISNRNRQDEASGFALGTDGVTADANPTTNILLQFQSDGTCVILRGSAFTNADDDDDEQRKGSWQWLPPDNNNKRINTIVFCIPVEGYCRTVTTKGTIQNVSWSDREQVSTKTSATYSVPKGDLYGQIRIDYGSKPGTLAMINAIDKKQPYGLLYVEKPMGPFGLTTKTVPCGKFTGTMEVDN